MALITSFPATNLLGIASSSTSTTYVSPTSSQSTTGGNTTLTATYRSAIFQLSVKQTSPSSSHLLDVYAQHSVDNGTTYDDFVHFSQIAGKVTVGTFTYQIAQWIRDTAASSSTAGNYQSMRTPATASLAAGLVLQGPVGATWRGFATVTGASSSQPWQLTLQAQVAQ
jgi:hypothetical protein